MDKNLSLRKNLQLMGLFSKAKEYQPLSNRVDIFNKAVKYGLKENVDYKKLSKMKVNYPINDEDSIPEFIQLRTDENQWNNLVDKIQNSFTPSLSKITAPYVVKLVLLNYIFELEKMNTTSSDEKLKDKESDVTILTNDLFGIEELKDKTVAIIDFYLNSLRDEKILLKNKELIENNFKSINK
ncbi:hypothetical protein AB2T96_16510 [Clostridium butyricum]|uniref:hypothetical protein n=1 Tax=Clostridium butyricum TaxID=1492 RepID=UPI0034650B52